MNLSDFDDIRPFKTIHEMNEEMTIVRSTKEGSGVNKLVPSIENANIKNRLIAVCAFFLIVSSKISEFAKFLSKEVAKIPDIIKFNEISMFCALTVKFKR